MTWFQILYWLPVWGPLLLVVAYGILFGAAKAIPGKWVDCVLLPLLLIAALLDIVLNYTLFNFYLLDPWPKQGEWTISQRLPRLNRRTGLLGAIPRALTAVLNALAWDGNHISSD